VQVRTLWLTDFRNYTAAQLDLAPGLTAVVGANGEGKTNLLEALGWLATLGSFRGAPTDALVRRGAPFAVVRALAEREGRELLIEAQLQPNGRNRVLVNRQPLRRARDLLGSLRVTVFTPDDLAIVKDGPAERRRLLDDALVSLAPRNDALRADVDKVLRQRNALLRSAAGRLDETAAFTLDVWDAKLAEAGAALVAARLDLLDRLRPALGSTYDALARRPAPGDGDVRGAVALGRGAAGLAGGRPRGGPAGRRAARGVDGGAAPGRGGAGHRGRPGADAGEPGGAAVAGPWRCGWRPTPSSPRRPVSAPVLLLDDVFSELDPERSAALLDELPAGQTLLTTPAGCHGRRAGAGAAPGRRRDPLTGTRSPLRHGPAGPGRRSAPLLGCVTPP
jgi:DNA replication and repair protein RecF